MKKGLIGLVIVAILCGVLQLSYNLYWDYTMYELAHERNYMWTTDEGKTYTGLTQHEYQKVLSMWQEGVEFETILECKDIDWDEVKSW